jgi:hypothetical protein
MIVGARVSLLLAARAQAAARYLPHRTRVLVIAEAPPSADDRYFYFERVINKDWLWIALMKALYPSDWSWITKQERSRKAYWLEKFRDDGFWLIDAVKEPLNGSETEVIAKIRANVSTLILEVHRIAPEQIVLIKTNVYDELLAPLREAGLNVVNEKALPFPSSGQQTKFHTEFRRLVDTGKLRV